MLTPEILRTKFNAGKPYDAYIASGTPDQKAKWTAFHQRVTLTPTQREVVGSFSRRINVLVISGLWCGDCAQQCPMFDHLAKVKPAAPGDPTAPGVDLRFLDRDEHIDLAEQVRICGGTRVPTVLFLNEDFEFLAIAGDKSLSRLRAIAARSLGAACAVPGAPVPPDEIAATLQDWANDLERAHLTARLSPRLRQRHQD